ncbi:sulfotransferase family protein [Desulforudis sp. 1031]|uniref:sulfotransferase family protein n=1 Tax=unclassified Candidatus Desulforudis TaxID=2635950 RepID=UPI003CF7519F
MLRLMLNNHPLISVPPECGFALWLYEKYKEKSFFDMETVKNFVEDVIKSKKFETWGIREEEVKSFMLSRKFKQYKEIAFAIYLIYAQKNGKNPTLVGDKNNFYIKHIAKIKEIFNDPKLIFIVRDGRDVAVSYRELFAKKINSIYAPNLPNSIEEIAHEWVNNNKFIAEELYERSLLITYEALVTLPCQTLEKICIFLGIDYNESMLDYYKNNDEPIEFLQWKSKTLEKPDCNNIGKYQNFLTYEEIILFESIAGETLNAFGYKLSNKKGAY